MDIDLIYILLNNFIGLICGLIDSVVQKESNYDSKLDIKEVYYVKILLFFPSFIAISNQSMTLMFIRIVNYIS